MDSGKIFESQAFCTSFKHNSSLDENVVLINFRKETNWIPKFYIVRLMRLFPVVILIVGHILTSKPGYSGPIDFPDEKENCMNNLIGILGLNLIDVDHIVSKNMEF